MKTGRNIQYVNRDFEEFRKLLITYAKAYFPNQYKDFNESNPETMLVEMMAVTGDVLGYYTDMALQESLLSVVSETKNLYNISQALGYKINPIVPANVILDVYHIVPAIGEGQNSRPDFRYGQYINSNMIVKTNDSNPIEFYTIEPIDFKYSSSFNPTIVNTYSVSQNGSIEYYLLKKQVKAVSGKIITETFDFTEPKPYDKIVLENEKISHIIDVVDSDGNVWYEVDYLAQDTVPISVRNTSLINPSLSVHSTSVPHLLCYKKTEYRFVTRRRKDNFFELQFGSGLSSENDEEIVPNPMNIGIGLNYLERVTDLSIDPSNFLYNRTYGSAPSYTTLTVRYSVTNGITDNVSSNSISKIDSISYPDESLPDIDYSIVDNIRNGITVNNPNPAWGGTTKSDIDELRQETMRHFAAQNRAVSEDDYILRCYSMPAKFGSIAKAFIQKDTQYDNITGNFVPNPNTLNLYVLAYDMNKNFVECNDALKTNLMNYLKQYRLLTDAINIKMPYIINIGVEIDIITRPDQNANEIILKCLVQACDFFKPERMEINKPIILSKLKTLLDTVEGVQTVLDVKIINLFDSKLGYNNNVYDISNATVGSIVYPSISPCVFEVKFPKKDIKIKIKEY